MGYQQIGRNGEQNDELQPFHEQAKGRMPSEVAGNSSGQHGYGAEDGEGYQYKQKTQHIELNHYGQPVAKKKGRKKSQKENGDFGI